MSTQGKVKPLPIEAIDKEALVNRNPHGDFIAVEAARPPYDGAKKWSYSKSPHPSWKLGEGPSSDEWKKRRVVTIDPYEKDRSPVLNYKLMISTTVPRPIALVSTVTEDGKTRNLAPISYFQNVASDPPIYMLSFPGRVANDTLRNIQATRELCISMTSDWIIEAANLASVNTPPHISEWDLSGLTPTSGHVVKCPFVAESAFSVECELRSSQQMLSKVDGQPSGTMVLVEAVRFHVWEDALGKDRGTVDISGIRPVFRAGGITYGTCIEGFEIPRPPTFRLLREDEKARKILRGEQ